MDRSLGSSGCARRVQQETKILTFAQHRIGSWSAGLQQLDVGKESLSLHFGRITPDNNNVLNRLKVFTRCLDLPKEGSAHDDRHCLGVVGDMSDLGAREQGRRRGAHGSQLQDSEIGDQGRGDVGRTQNDSITPLHSQVTQRTSEFVSLRKQLIVGKPLVFKEHRCTVAPSNSNGLAQQFLRRVEFFSVGGKLGQGINALWPQLAWRQIVSHFKFSLSNCRGYRLRLALSYQVLQCLLYPDRAPFGIGTWEGHYRIAVAFEDKQCGNRRSEVFHQGAFKAKDWAYAGIRAGDRFVIDREAVFDAININRLASHARSL